MHQGQEFPQLIHGPIAAGEDDEGARGRREPQLAHEKVLEDEVQFRGHIRVGLLLGRELDIQADGEAARLGRAPVGRFHDPRTSAGAHDQKMFSPAQRERPARDQFGELSRLLIVARHLDRHQGCLEIGAARRRSAVFTPALELTELLIGLLARQQPG